MITVYLTEHLIPMSTFDEVLARARELPLVDQLRLRNALPVAPACTTCTRTTMDSQATSPFSRLAGVIDEPPQNLLTEEDQELYGR